MKIREALASVRAGVEAAARRVGRDPASVCLIAVSKTHSVEMILEAYEAGQRHFGENYAQELRDKMAALADRTEIQWHVIGPLQSNKVKYVAGKALVHTLDRLGLAEQLVRRAEGAEVSALVSVNIGGEPHKSGVAPAELPALLEALAPIEGLRVAGLMCIPPANDDPEASRPWFRALAALRDRHLPGGGLSMGMSHDYEVAIEEGATWVRVGTAIFGARARSS
jgi:pyridoxal phosphate enzyme (YggS family)